MALDTMDTRPSRISRSYYPCCRRCLLLVLCYLDSHLASQSNQFSSIQLDLLASERSSRPYLMSRVGSDTDKEGKGLGENIFSWLKLGPDCPTRGLFVLPLLHLSLSLFIFLASTINPISDCLFVCLFCFAVRRLKAIRLMAGREIK